MTLLMIFLITVTFSGHILSELEGILNKPPDCSGPEAAFYHSFDTSDGLVMWEGTQQIGEVPLVSGKVILTIFSAIFISKHHDSCCLIVIL